MAASTTFLQSANNAGNNSTYTFSSQNFGAAAADRYIIVAVHLDFSNQSNSVSSVTIGGVTATHLGTQTGNQYLTAFYMALVPTGTSGNVVVTCSTIALAGAIGMWSATGIHSVPAIVKTNNAEDPTATVDIPAGGAVVAAAYSPTNTTTSWTNLTERYDAVFADGASNHTITGASDNFASQTNARAITADFGSPTTGRSTGVFVVLLPTLNAGFSDDFTGANGTDIQGYNNWSSKTDSGGADTTTEIQSNRGACTAAGEKFSYRTYSSWDGSGARVTWYRYSGSGQRYINYFILGSSDVSTSANFRSNSINIVVSRSDQNNSNSSLTINDGSTQVATKSMSFQLDGSDITMTFRKNSDGSGVVFLKQGSSYDSLTWAARTWTKGGGTNFGVNPTHNGSDGTGATTLSGFDDFRIDVSVQQFTQAITASATALGTGIKQAVKTFSVGSLATATMEAIRVVFQTLTASITAGVSFGSMAIGKVMDVGVNATLATTRAMDKVLSVGATGLGTANKHFELALTALIAQAAVVVEVIKMAVRELTVGATASVTITNSFVKELIANVSATATHIAARLRELIASVGASTPAIQKEVGKIFTILSQARVRLGDMFYRRKYTTQNDTYEGKYTAQGDNYQKKY